jgi:4-hydroxy-3-polyprenylbenzoate decarboxylase
MSDYVVGITGASGSIYGIRLIQQLALKQHTVNVIVTSAGKMVMKEELGVSGLGKIDKLGLSKVKGNIKI